MSQGIRIGSNISSLTAQRQLGTATSALSRNYERLSSGQRINRASDDSAGLAIAASLDLNARVLTKAVGNLNDGVSAANIAEGALQTLKDISMRQRELATQAANGSYTLSQRRALDAEANALVSEYNRIVQSTQFNGKALFQNNSQQLNIQAGTGTAGNIAFATGSQLSRNVGDGTFEAHINAGVGSDPGGTATGDMDNNGVLDLVVAQYGGAGIAIVESVNGTLQTTQMVGSGEHVRSAIGDINGDGRLDIAATWYSGATATVFLQNANGTFTAGTNYAVGTAVDAQVALADLNGDGRSDLVVTDFLSNSVGVRLANSDGTLGSYTSYATGTGPAALTIADFNGDGKADVATGNGTQVSVLFSTGSGTLETARTSAVAGSGVIAAGDFDGNGYADIATLTGIFLGNGDGTFRSSGTTYAAGTAVTVTDINGDGYHDAAVAYGATGTARVIAGSGNGSFTTGTPVAIATAGTSLLTLSAGDFNGDGRTDLSLGGALTAVAFAKGPSVATTPYLNITTRQGALEAMAVIDQNLQRISNEMGYLGAITSRFEAALGTLQARRENYLAASARITDVDVAGESASLVANQIRQQVATSMLGQANQQPQIALSLLQQA